MTLTKRLMTMIDRGREGKNLGLDIGLPKTKLYTDGLLRSTYTVIMGQSASGKTSLALYSYIFKPLYNNENVTILYFSLELSTEVLLGKILSLYLLEKYSIDISYKEILSRGKILNDELYEVIVEASDWLKSVEHKLIIYDKPLNAKRFSAITLKELAKKGDFIPHQNRQEYAPNDSEHIFQIVIDHLSLVRKSPGNTKKEEMDLISSEAVRFKNMCGVSPLFIMQVNRDSTSMDRRKGGFQLPQMSDSKDSGSPIEDSDVTMAIFNPYKEKLANYKGYDVKQLAEKARSICILKNRFGDADLEIMCAFYGRSGYWVELPSPKEIYDYDHYSNILNVLNKQPIKKETTDKTFLVKF